MLFEINILLPIFFAALFLVVVFGLYIFTRRRETMDQMTSRMKTAQELGVQAISTENVKLFESQQEHILEVRLDDFFKELGKKRGVSTGMFQKLLARVSTGAALLLFVIAWGIAFSALKFMLAVDITEAIIFGFPLAILLSLMVLRKYQSRRETEFMNNFPLAFDIVSRGLKAGGTLEKTFKTVSTEIQGPIAKEFAIINEQIDFGVPFEEAMVNAAERIRIDDFSFFAIALIIQRGSGGSLSELVSGISTFIRKRHELRMKVNALSAEAKATGAIVGGLPLVILFIMYFINPEHIEILRYDPAGRKLAFFLVGYMLLGFLIIRKMTKMKI